MYPKWLVAATGCLAACLLAACGGGGSDAGSDVGPVAPTTANVAPTASAGSPQSVLAGATVTLDGSASVDPENAALGYTWVLTSRPAGSSAALSQASSMQPQLATDLPGDYVASLTVSDGVLSSAASSVTVSALAAEALAIQFDKSEPLSGAVTLSLSGAAVTAPIAWYVDLAAIGSGPTAQWFTERASNANHLVMARIEVAPGRFMEVRRSVNVSNSGIFVSVNTNFTGAPARLQVLAIAPTGIASVSMSLDGQPLAILTETNGLYGHGTSPSYDFTLPSGLVSGVHPAVVTVIDRVGVSQVVEVGVPISNAPVVDIATPLDGGFVLGTLRLAGRVTSDKPGAVSVVGILGDIEFMNTTGPDFDASYDVTGLSPSMYTLQIIATDATGSRTWITRHVIVASRPELTYTPVLSLGAKGSLLAVEGDRMLYKAQDQTVRLRDTAVAGDAVLEGVADIADPGGWQLSGGFAYAVGHGSDCAANMVCVYQWRADGLRRNLMAAYPSFGPSAVPAFVVRDGFVALIAADPGGDSFQLLDLATGILTPIVPPASPSPYAKSFDVAVVAGVVHLVYGLQFVAGSPGGEYAVFEWVSTTRQSTRLSAPGVSGFDPQVDATRVAWWSASGLTPLPPFPDLVTQPTGGGPLTPSGTSVREFTLRDGALAWIEHTATAWTLKASTPAATTTLSALPTATLLGVSDGFVVYSDRDHTYAWNAALGRSTLLMEWGATFGMANKGSAYLVIGDTQTVYKLPLR